VLEAERESSAGLGNRKYGVYAMWLEQGWPEVSQREWSRGTRLQNKTSTNTEGLVNHVAGELELTGNGNIFRSLS
jgi:hypothetical protein